MPALRGFDPNSLLAQSFRWEKPHASIVQFRFQQFQPKSLLQINKTRFFPCSTTLKGVPFGS
jgi:hypothetical protein